MGIAIPVGCSCNINSCIIIKYLYYYAHVDMVVKRIKTFARGPGTEKTQAEDQVYLQPGYSLPPDTGPQVRAEWESVPRS